jgi:hypothetical protein
MAVSGLFGGVILAAMEGAGSLMGRLMGGSYDPVAPVLDIPTQQEQQQQEQPQKGRFFA